MKPLNALGSRVYSINQNYSWGADMQKAIGDYASTGGYTVVDKTLHDVNKVQDFSPYVAKIATAKADTVITGNWSNDLLLLMKATKAAGLKTRFATVFLDQPGNVGNAGEVALGHYVAHPFNAEAGGADDEARQRLQGQGRPPAGLHRAAVDLRHRDAGRGAEVGQAGGRQAQHQGTGAGAGKGQGQDPAGRDEHARGRPPVQLPMVVSVVSKEAKFKVDGTDTGFKPVRPSPRPTPPRRRRRAARCSAPADRPLPQR